MNPLPGLRESARISSVAEWIHPRISLQLCFSTHDVTLSGWQRRDFLRLLREGKVAAVKTGHARYANLRKEPYIAEISITAAIPSDK